VTVFGNYARYYDLLYKDKDYAGEARYVRRLLEKHAPGARRVLELGSGTGRHAERLGRDGYEVVGIERSAEMLARARQRAAAAGDAGGRLEFREGDIRDFSLGRSFDAVISLFHVISYQTGNDDLIRLFRCVKQHLVSGGAFVFDVWYGPAVLAQKPERRELRLEDDVIEVTRFAEPEIHHDRNVVDVNYEILIRDKSTGTEETVREKHPMRYLFRPELDRMLGHVGLTLVHAEEWLTGKPPGPDTWGVCFIAKA